MTLPPGSRFCPLGMYYHMPGGTLGCRCIVCARCGEHTGNNTQGHYWSICRRSGQMEEFHLCCPDNCELDPTDQSTSQSTSQSTGHDLHFIPEET